MSLAYAGLCGYLLGSLAFGVWCGRLLGIDLHRYGSGNPGATNVQRLAGWRAGLFVLLLDMIKGAAAVLLARMIWGPPAGLAAGLAAIAGHVWPLFARFRGGKGVATAFGVFAVAAPWSAGFGLLLFGLALWPTRTVSLASLTGALGLGAGMWLFDGLGIERVTPGWLAAGMALPAFLAWTHRENLRRLLNGEEPRIRLGRRDG
ncbi:hypothetical protein ABI59_23075 [Acidobacteria bacterium Mor1]|nr:hypothetical protein ABI59_23075 [Acidobacteria bacterium Mor1]